MIRTLGVEISMAAVATGLLFAQAPLPPPTSPPPGAGGLELTTAHLQQVGLHMPSYLPNVQDFFNFENRLTTHQEFTFTWNALPGYQGSQEESDVAIVPLSTEFVLSGRNQRVHGGADKMIPMVMGSPLVVAGIDAAKQVRGLVLRSDGRSRTIGESFEGNAIHGHVTIEPTSTFIVQFPDDPQIRSILIFRPVIAQGGFYLQYLNTIPVPVK